MKKLLCLLGCILTVWLIQSANSSESEKFVFKDTVSVLNVREIDGDVWLCTSEGAYRFDGENYTRTPDQNLTVWDIRKAGGDLWLISTDGAYRVDGTHARRIPDRDLHVRGLESVDGRVFFYTDKGTYYLDRDKSIKAPEGVERGSSLWRSVQKAGGVTWVWGLWGEYGSEMSAIEGLDLSPERLKEMRVRNVIPVEESAWLSTQKGAYEVREGRILRHIPGARLKNVVRVGASVWLLTETGAFELREGQILRHILKDEEVFDIANSPRGLFVGTDKGAYILKNGKTVSVIEVGEEDRIRKIYVSKESVWLSAKYDTYCVDNSGVREIEDVGGFNRDWEMDGFLWVSDGEDIYRINGSSIKHILEDRSQIYDIKKIDNDIWGLTHYDGVYRIIGEENNHYFERERIVAMQTDGESIWIASDDGCYKLNGNDIRRIPDKDMAVSSMVVSNGVIWITTEKGESLRIQDDHAEHLVNIDGIQETKNQLGDGFIHKRGSISSVSFKSEDDSSVRFDIEFNLRYVNEGSQSAFIWDPKGYPEKRSGYGGYKIALSREDALNGQYIYDSAAGVSARDPIFDNWRCALDAAMPPEKLIRRLGPGEAWEFPKYQYRITFNKEFATFGWGWDWERIKKQKNLWIQIIDNTWHYNLEHSSFGRPFGHMLRRRWQPYGMLQLGYLTSEPIPLTLPDQ